MEAKARLEKELEQMRFQHQVELKKMEIEGYTNRESVKEDRKDKRTEKQASQQSKMINQRKKDLPPTDFESQQQEAQDPMSGMIQKMNQQNML